MDAFSPPPVIYEKQVEQAVLGALLADSASVRGVHETLFSYHFYDKGHQSIYESILSLDRDEQVIDVITIGERLKMENKLALAGGQAYLVELSDKASSAAPLNSYVQLLINYAIRRDLATQGRRIREIAQQGEQDPKQMLDEAQQVFFDIGNRNMRAEASPLDRLFTDFWKRINQPKDAKKAEGVPSGFRSLDRQTGGWQDGDLVILAARPSVGKTALALAMARNAALEFKAPVAFFSMEMSASQLMMRLICSEGKIDSNMLRQGDLGKTEMAVLASQRIKNLTSSPVYIYDLSAPNVMDLRAKARYLCATKGVRCIFVDYLQLIMAERKPKDSFNREQEIAMISRTLKATAKELHIPVIALAQLNRSVEQRSDKRPVLSDLRESGAIEQDADQVILLYRPEYYGIEADEHGNSTAGLMEVVIAKHRNGPTGKLSLAFDKSYGRFSEIQEGSFSPQAEPETPIPSSINNMQPEQEVSHATKDKDQHETPF